MRLSELLRDVPVERIDGPDVEVTAVRDDSRQVGPGDLFVAVRGQTVDGHDFVGTAAQKGAHAAVVERARDVSRETFTRVYVPSGAQALARIAANRHGR